jgi:hypothetical protein
MRGHLPKTFDGQHKNVDKFIHKFDLWWVCNLRNEVITNLFMQVVLTLSYIKGPRVNDWVFQQARGAAVKVYRDMTLTPLVFGMYNNNNERLWKEFLNDFCTTFMDTMSAEQAYANLLKLEMKGEEIDEYITNFEFLLRRARWEKMARGTLEMFKHGLPKKIH